MDRRTFLAAMAAAPALAVPEGAEALAGHGARQPNFVCFMSDDQDSRIPLKYMKNIRRRIADVGINFVNATVPLSECEPSRATFQSGQFYHNHGAIDYAAWRLQEDNALPVWMQAGGYYTGFIGKYMSDYGENAQPDHIPPGWDYFAAIYDAVHPFSYYGPTFSINGVVTSFGLDQYITDIQVEQAVALIDDAVASGKPFFLVICWLAPHSGRGDGSHRRVPKAPAPRNDHYGTMDGVDMPHRPDWGEVNASDKPDWVQQLPLPDAETCNVVWRRRLECIMTTGQGGTIDDGVGTILDKLESAGVLDQTHTPYFSDNGYMIGEHRWTGKMMEFEESMRIPLFWRGPGIPTTGQILTPLVNTLDITATILDLAGVASGRVADGRTLRPMFHGVVPAHWRTVTLYEWTTFQGVRSANYMYAETNDLNGFFAELYDTSQDPYEMRNKLISKPEYAGVLAAMKHELDVLKTSAGPTAWRTTVLPDPPA